VEFEQKEQRKLIDSLYKQNEELLALLQSKTLATPACTKPQNFEEAFASFVNSYETIDPCERPRKIRNLRQLLPNTQRSMVMELVSALVGHVDPISAECMTEVLPEALDAQPLSPGTLSTASELSNGYWPHLCTPIAVCVPSSPDLGDLGDISKDEVNSDLFDFLNL